jgi:lipopolysaccharide transport system permease protein
MLGQHLNEQTITIGPHERRAFGGVKEIWEFRGLFFFLAWRDLKVRYKQTVLGVIWVLLQPLMLMLIFTFVFGRLAKLPSEDAPYHLFVLAGLVPWLLFSSVVGQVSNSLVTDARIISKIYFPRLIVPLSASISCLIDSFISLGMFLVIYFASGGGFSLRLLFMPIWIFGTLLVALSFSVGLAALNAKFRDFRFVIPFGLQLTLFLTPVVYSSSLVPESLHWLYALNPMALMVEGFRWSALGVGEITGGAVLITGIVLTTVGMLSIRYFRAVEDFLADIL